MSTVRNPSPVRLPPLRNVDRVTRRPVPGWEDRGMLIDFGSEQLGPRALGEPMVLRTSKRAWSNKATVTVTEYERGWTIEGAPTDRAASHHGRFTGVVRRCLINHRGRVPADCLGHLDNVAKLANKVLTTYRLSMPKMITD